jgi:hypothetical protein
MVQIIVTNLTYDHINDSLFIQSYIKTEIISLVQGHINQCPETQIVIYVVCLKSSVNGTRK